MIAFLGVLAGFLSSAIPEALKYFKQKQDNAHELKVLGLQMQAQAQGHTERLAEINTQADISESQALYKSSEVSKTGVKWVDAVIGLLTSSVRPVITYAFFGLYASIKVSLYQGSMLELWTDLDMAVFATIVGYWFGSRSLEKFSKR